LTTLHGLPQPETLNEPPVSVSVELDPVIVMALGAAEFNPIPPVTLIESLDPGKLTTVPLEPRSVSGGKGKPPDGRPPLAEFQKRGTADRLY
jgi:hypothetical protein